MKYLKLFESGSNNTLTWRKILDDPNIDYINTERSYISRAFGKEAEIDIPIPTDSKSYTNNWITFASNNIRVTQNYGPISVCLIFKNNDLLAVAGIYELQGVDVFTPAPFFIS